MPIVRTKHNRENPYTMLKNSSLWDNNLSLEAIAVWARLISRPNDWKTNLVELGKACKVGPEKIRRIFKELLENRYAYRVQHRDKQLGTFDEWEYWIFEQPIGNEELEEFKKCLPQTVLPRPAEPSVGKPATTNKQPNQSSSPSSSPDVEAEVDEPNRTEPKHKPDRIGSSGSPFSSEGKEENLVSIEEVEMVCEHALQGKICLRHSDIRVWTKRYGLEKTIQAVDMAIQDMKSGSLLTNPAGWITNALKKGY